MAEFKEFKVVPDVIDTWPGEICDVDFGTTHKANVGNVLSVKQTQAMPKFRFNSEKNAYYTIMCVDPDAPSRETHEFRHYCHFVAVNIHGTGEHNHVDVHTGHNVCPYLGPAPPAKTGLHRYVFLVYKQPKQYDTHNLDSFGAGDSRKNFIPDDFIEQHFGGALKPQLQAANFFQAQHE